MNEGPERLSESAGEGVALPVATVAANASVR